MLGKDSIESPRLRVRFSNNGLLVTCCIVGQEATPTTKPNKPRIAACKVARKHPTISTMTASI